MKGAKQVRDDLITWDGDLLVVRSYLGGRKQRVRFEKPECGTGWLAITGVYRDFSTGQPASRKVFERLSPAAEAFTGVCFRLGEDDLEAYCLLTPDQFCPQSGRLPRLSKVGQRMVVYLAQVADRLEFELHRGADNL